MKISRNIILYGAVLAVFIQLLRNVFLQSSLCPLLVCMRPLITCATEPDCLPMLNCLQECEDSQSGRRQESASLYSHHQFPNSPNLCRYQCFDLILSKTGEDVIECVGGSGICKMPPTECSDECAPIEADQVLPFHTIPREVFEGRWEKLYTNSWDIWPCQRTHFYAPFAKSPNPEPWMKAWPLKPHVWRMNVNWTVTPSLNRSGILHDGDASSHPSFIKSYAMGMSEELYVGEQWDFSGTDTATPPSTTVPTLKTRGHMWGVDVHENWYFLDYDPEMQTLLIHVCAYTPQIKGFDAITMVLRKAEECDTNRSANQMTKKMEQKVEQTALRILGQKFGSLRRREKCNIEEKH